MELDKSNRKPRLFCILYSAFCSGYFYCFSFFYFSPSFFLSLVDHLPEHVSHTPFPPSIGHPTPARSRPARGPRAEGGVFSFHLKPDKVSLILNAHPRIRFPPSSMSICFLCAAHRRTRSRRRFPGERHHVNLGMPCRRARFRPTSTWTSKHVQKEIVRSCTLPSELGSRTSRSSCADPRPPSCMAAII